MARTSLGSRGDGDHQKEDDGKLGKAENKEEED